MASYRIGIDTGGTFTDVAALEAGTGAMFVTKTPSTPSDPSLGLVAGIEKVLKAAAGGDIDSIIHGTTVATNALLEERFDGLGLITTRGFRNILEIARQSVPSGYGNSYFWVKPDRIVPLERVREVTERMNYRGEVLVPLCEADVRVAARFFRVDGVKAVAVCLIHAYADGAHEREVRRVVLEEYPEAILSLSSEVLPEYREYERTMTTAIDAFVKPVVQIYVDRAVTRLAGGDDTRTSSANAHPTPFLIMQSNGGVLSAREVARQPITTLLSGPAAGALGASYLASLAGYDRVLTSDAGGTSTDICLVDGGQPHVTTEGRVGRFPVKVPMVDITTIGTGGGSIAWIDASGGLRVGPKSAGADPGPMCYGRGGEEPTLTDANVALGRLPPALLGSEMPLDADMAWEGLRRLASRLGMEPERLAAGIVELADWNQVNAIRQVTVKKGLDPRDYALVPFGGSGPLQAARVAELLGIQTIVIPPNPGNVSAFGLLVVDLKTDHVLTCVQREDSLDIAALNQAFSRLAEAATQELDAEGVAEERRRLIRSADVRYFGQAYEVRVPVPAGRLDGAAIDAVIDRFHDEHQCLYGYSYRDKQLVEIVNVRLSAVGLVERPPLPKAADGISDAHRAATPSGERNVYLPPVGRFERVPTFERSALTSGHQIDGPGIVEEYGSTTAVPPGWRARVDSSRNLILTQR